MKRSTFQNGPNEIIREVEGTNGDLGKFGGKEVRILFSCPTEHLISIQFMSCPTVFKLIHFSVVNYKYPMTQSVWANLDSG